LLTFVFLEKEEHLGAIPVNDNIKTTGNSLLSTLAYILSVSLAVGFFGGFFMGSTVHHFWDLLLNPNSNSNPGVVENK
jgi:hypothetical protein